MVPGDFGRGEGIRTPGPMLPKHVRYQTALHPVRVVPTQATLIIIPETRSFVNTFFQKNQNYFQTVSAEGFTGIFSSSARKGGNAAQQLFPFDNYTADGTLFPFGRPMVPV